MIPCNWSLRPPGHSHDPYKEYRKHPTVCSITINHGGAFTSPPNRRYRGGKVNWFDGVDTDSFSVIEVSTMLKELGYVSQGMQFYYKIPNANLDNGLIHLKTDMDVLDMAKYVNTCKVIDVFVDHPVDEVVFANKNVSDLGNERYGISQSSSKIKGSGIGQSSSKVKASGIGQSSSKVKPIITSLEFIREYLMKRIVIVQQAIRKSTGPLTPNATRIFSVILKAAAQYTVTWNGGDLYQACGPWGEKCVVNMNLRSCSCRKWELTGMPGKHAVAAIWNMASNGMESGIPESWVHESYWLKTWEEMYRFKINPVDGPEMWKNADIPITLTPPNYVPPIGRPRKKRQKSAGELYDGLVKNGRLSRAGKTVTCSKCGQQGHNKSSCKGQRGLQMKCQLLYKGLQM